MRLVEKLADHLRWLAGFAGPIICVAYLILRVTDIDYAHSLHASWSMTGTLTAAQTLRKTEERLQTLGYEGYSGPTRVNREGRCRWYRELLIPNTAGRGTRINLSVRCDGSRIEVHHYAHGEFWSQAQLDHYYMLQRQLFPGVLAIPPEELDVETLAHPGNGIPVEELEGFTWEPLDRWNTKRMALWRAGQYPGTAESRRQRREREVEYVGNWTALYAISALIGGLIFLAIWRQPGRRKMSVRDQRVMFTTLAVLVFTPAPVIYFGWTTLVVQVVTGLIGLMLPWALFNMPLYAAVPVSIAILAWQLSRCAVSCQTN